MTKQTKVNFLSTLKWKSLLLSMLKQHVSWSVLVWGLLADHLSPDLLFCSGKPILMLTLWVKIKEMSERYQKYQNRNFRSLQMQYFQNFNKYKNTNIIWQSQVKSIFFFFLSNMLYMIKILYSIDDISVLYNEHTVQQRLQNLQQLNSI